jgi:hypothetical protein
MLIYIGAALNGWTLFGSHVLFAAVVSIGIETGSHPGGKIEELNKTVVKLTDEMKSLRRHADMIETAMTRLVDLASKGRGR